MNPSDVEKLIEAGLPGAEVRVQSDDNTHYVALVITDAFSGKRQLARHQLIYQCLGDLMGNDIHAMSIRAHTPAEWQELDPSRQS
jgi:acid stress-induced BolA-like protein IbaG/YrbA